MCDTLAQENIPTGLTLYALGYSVGTLVNTILFYVFGSWVSMLIYYYVLGYVVLLALFYWFVESPPIEIVSHNKDPEKSY